MAKEVTESRLTILKREAVKAKDFKFAEELANIELETDNELLRERNKGLVIGFGSAIACVVIGGVVTKIVISNKAE
jgi:hypothetical protein